MHSRVALRLRVELAHEPSFELAGLAVDPGQRLIGDERVEPRVMQVLVALHRASGETLTRDDLARSCWEGLHVGDDAISRVIVRLRRVGEASGRFTVETLPRVGYRLALNSVDPGPAPEAADIPPPSPVRKRRLWLALAALILPLILAAWWLSRPALPRDVAVRLQPIVLAGAGLPDGIGPAFDAELHAALSKHGVAVGDRGELELTSTIQPAGTRFRFSTRIVRGGATLLTVSNEFPTARLAALAISPVLQCATEGLANDRGRLDSAGAVLWLQVCEALGPGGRRSRVLDLGRTLVRTQPDFIEGWLAVANAIGFVAMQYPENFTPALRDEAANAARRAIAIDPDNANGYTYAALFLPPGQAMERERLLRLATAARPEKCRCSHQFLGDFLLQTGRIKDAATAYGRGLDQDMAAPLAFGRLALASFGAGAPEQAGEWLRRRDAAAPATSPRARFAPALWLGDWTAAAANVPIEDPAKAGLVRDALLARASGDAAGLARAGEALERMSVTHADEPFVVPVLTALGRTDAAFRALESSRLRRGVYAEPGRFPGWAAPMLFDPLLRPLFEDPRMTGFLQRAGFIDYWRASGTRPDMCGSGGRPAFCRQLDQ